MLGLHEADIVEATSAQPFPEPRNVPLVLRHRVRRAAVGAELDEEAGDGGLELHGLDTPLNTYSRITQILLLPLA